MIVFLDLSHPETFQSILEPILSTCRNRSDQILAGLKSEEDQQSAEVYERIVKRFTQSEAMQQLSPIVGPLNCQKVSKSPRIYGFLRTKESSSPCGFSCSLSELGTTIFRWFLLPSWRLKTMREIIKNYDTERKRTTYRLLRYLAHINGASLTVFLCFWRVFFIEI